MKLLDEIQGVFGAVLMFRNGAAEFLEEQVEIGGRASVHFLPERQDDQAVEQTHDTVARLMNGQHHQASCLRNILEGAHLVGPSELEKFNELG